MKGFARFTSVALLGCMVASAEGYDDEAKKKFFNFSGSLESFTKVGFNNASVDTKSGQYPTESFTTIMGLLDTTYDVNLYIPEGIFNKFEFGLGAAAAGLVWDSSKYDGYTGATGQGGNNTHFNGSGINNNYIGAYFGPTANGTSGSGKFSENRYIIVHNAYLDLETELGGVTYGFRGGRYASTMEYHSGYTQGFEFTAAFGYGDTEYNPANMVKFMWFSSFGRGFPYSQYLLDFYFPKTTTSGGKEVNLGIHAFVTDVTYGGPEENDEGYKVGYTILARPFLYFYPGLYEASGLKLVYENHFGNGMAFKVTGQGYMLHVTRPFTTATNSNNKRYDETVDELSGNLNLIGQFFIDNYNVRLGYYQNFGSANSHFGTYGNPMGFDFWTTSIYDIGGAVSDIINRNALSFYLSGGGDYDFSFGKFSWEVLGRITRSPRSDEESVALFVSHTFKNNIALGVKVEWLRDTTKTGYNPGANLGANDTLKSTRVDDRSHAYGTFAYYF